MPNEASGSRRPSETPADELDATIIPAVVSDIAPGSVPETLVPDAEDQTIGPIAQPPASKSVRVSPNVSPDLVGRYRSASENNTAVETKWEEVPLGSGNDAKKSQSREFANIMTLPETRKIDLLRREISFSRPRRCGLLSCCGSCDSTDDQPRCCVCYDSEVGCVYTHFWRQAFCRKPDCDSSLDFC
eukprot:CAMPEP_0184365192 /NCGR_PEP_ID=MMETSP1089-20130417/147605_1 /TAXON_ID=38269 ORGANISM="Gloeochaete wittrockiana, Strain SAG46.84" /NCGR_SAMPLE_ID=MMETSP1089 /ASSEMBLY_ACC=CAM_ASM_000445 /LENGTH=186 /DNA_ID=CAMNT_0026706319 /DNA_START=326 /DNA_END=883 /DNA_ORIENTATION=-